ncbi:MAG: signal peptide peptidase SppA [Sulfurospirillaceae bacterium]|nr:signal peptide peptidase SppA [Sulfurospirillaceae bacterium]MCK9545507.1 signal peptide peptidase SppA [Sulfurospirillaceae bacterium]
MFKMVFKSINEFLSFIGRHFKALVFLLFISWLFTQTSTKNIQTPNLASVEIYGTIDEAKKLTETIYELENSSDIKGVLLHIDSPGGALGASVEVMMAVKSLVAKKPVVAYGAGTMASGSYYASIWADHIVANPGSFVGSIGVLFQAPNIKPLADKLGVKEQVVTAGRYKQIGTFTREWEEFEKEAIKELVDEAYLMFVNDVKEARKIDLDDEVFAQGRVFLASKAKDIGLVDDIGSLQDAKKVLISLSGVSEPKWKEPTAIDKALSKLKSQNIFGVFNYGLKAIP